MTVETDPPIRAASTTDSRGAVLSVWIRWCCSTDHKEIGTLFLVLSIIAGILGGAMAGLVRMELAEPGIGVLTQYTADTKLVEPVGGLCHADAEMRRGMCEVMRSETERVASAKNFYHVLMTYHGLIMIFFMVMPALLGGFGNWFVPILIGTREMAFPRLSNLSFWLYVAAGGLLLFSIFTPSLGGQIGFGGGWELLPPLSTSMPGPALDLLIMSLLLVGVSNLLGAVNFITTILNLRAPQLTLKAMPLFPWSVLVTSVTQVVTTPFLMLALILLLSDKLFNTAFFDPHRGGDPLLYQQLFWVYGHFAVFTLILPAVGIVSQIISTFSEKPAFEPEGVALAMMAMAVIGLLAWGQHMLTAGLSAEVKSLFVLMGMLAVLPMGFFVFSWMATMWGGSLTLRTPMVWALGFVFIFTLGGIMGGQLVSGVLGQYLVDTTYQVAQIHYALGMGAIFGFFAAWYYWHEKMFGRPYRERWANTQFFVLFVGMNLTFFPMYFLGMQGMPSGLAQYAAGYTFWNGVSTNGYYLMALSFLIWVFVEVDAFWLRPKEPHANPWGKGATTREWSLPAQLMPPAIGRIPFPKLTFKLPSKNQ